jgi:membrane protease YdiL (CAAX protease family)
MLGILVQLAISLVIIWFVEKKNLSVLGFRPTRKRIPDFLLFFVVSAFCCALGFCLKIYFGHQQWQVNPAFDARLLLSGLWWNIKSVLFEELIFRGVLLYILIKRIGPTKAILVSAICFGIYHWFSFGVIGQPMQMLFVFIITGLMGMVLAFGYAKTFSLYIPFGIHLGWNFTQIFVFSGGPIGDGLLVPVRGAEFRTDSYLVFFVVMFLPLLLALFINFWLIKNKRQQVGDPSVGIRSILRSKIFSRKY